MKRAALFAVIVAAAAYGEPDVAPWESITSHKRFVRPTKFEQEVLAASVDAGNINSNTSVRINGKYAATAQYANDGGVQPALIVYGSGTCNADGGCPAAFGVTYSVAPLCFCWLADAGTCGLYAATTTTSAFFTIGAASSPYSFQCVGQR